MPIGHRDLRAAVDFPLDELRQRTMPRALRHAVFDGALRAGIFPRRLRFAGARADEVGAGDERRRVFDRRDHFRLVEKEEV